VTVSDMEYPQSLVACSHYNCLYVSDWSSPGYIHRVELLNKSVTKWTMKERSYGLSLTTVHNVIVTLYYARTIQEYSTQGVLLRTISLDVSIDSPGHSIEQSTGQFVVCHAGSTYHRVCIVDTQGHIVRSYGRGAGSADGQLSCPYYLSVHTSDHVFVADYGNNKVRLFSPSLTHLGDVTLTGHQLSCPYRLHYDQHNERLYISEAGGRLFVVSVSSE